MTEDLLDRFASWADRWSRSAFRLAVALFLALIVLNLWRWAI